MSTGEGWTFLMAGNGGGSILGYYLSQKGELHAVPLEFVLALKAEAVLDIELGLDAHGWVQVYRGGRLDLELPLELLLHVLHSRLPPVRGFFQAAPFRDAKARSALGDDNHFENESGASPAPPALPATPAQPVEEKGD
jgi:hypothetical protein